MKPINNKTQLNSTLFTFTSSGAIDVVMPLYPEDKRDYKQPPYRSKSDKNNRWWEYGPSVNNWPPPVVQEKWDNIPIGDRHTVFLEPLFTNSYLINLEMLGLHKTVFVNFTTTRDYSFSLHHSGNKNLPFNVVWGKGAELWRKTTVRNLEQYFDLWGEDELEFNIVIHKVTSYKYAVDLTVNLPGNPAYKVMYLPNGGRYTFADEAVEGLNYTFKDFDCTAIKSRGRSLLKEWNTKPDGTGTSYLPGDTVLFTEPIKVYAIWDPANHLTDLEIVAYDIINDTIITHNYHTTEIRDSQWHIPTWENWWDKDELQGYEFQYCTKNISGDIRHNSGEEISVNGDTLRLYYVFEKV